MLGKAVCPLFSCLWCEMLPFNTRISFFFFNTPSYLGKCAACLSYVDQSYSLTHRCIFTVLAKWKTVFQHLTDFFFLCLHSFGVHPTPPLSYIFCPLHQTCSLHLNPFDILPTSPFHPPRTTHCLRNRLSVSIHPSRRGLTLFCPNTERVMPAGCANLESKGLTRLRHAWLLHRWMHPL